LSSLSNTRPSLYIPLVVDTSEMQNGEFTRSLSDGTPVPTVIKQMGGRFSHLTNLSENKPIFTTRSEVLQTIFRPILGELFRPNLPVSEVLDPANQTNLAKLSLKLQIENNFASPSGFWERVYKARLESQVSVPPKFKSGRTYTITRKEAFESVNILSTISTSYEMDRLGAARGEEAQNSNALSKAIEVDGGSFKITLRMRGPSDKKIAFDVYSAGKSMLCYDNQDSSSVPNLNISGGFSNKLSFRIDVPEMPFASFGPINVKELLDNVPRGLARPSRDVSKVGVDIDTSRDSVKYQIKLHFLPPKRKISSGLIASDSVGIKNEKETTKIVYLNTNSEPQQGPASLTVTRTSFYRPLLKSSSSAVAPSASSKGLSSSLGEDFSPEKRFKAAENLASLSFPARSSSEPYSGANYLSLAPTPSGKPVTPLPLFTPQHSAPSSGTNSLSSAFEEEATSPGYQGNADIFPLPLFTPQHSAPSSGTNSLSSAFEEEATSPGYQGYQGNADIFPLELL
jgi:hypothetical protein